MKIELLRPHRHNKTEHKPGEKIDVNDESARWLISLKVAKKATTKPKKSTRTGD